MSDQDQELPEDEAEEQPKRRRRRRRGRGGDSEATEGAAASEATPDAELDDAVQAAGPDDADALTDEEAEHATEVMLEADDEAEGEADEDLDAEEDEEPEDLEEPEEDEEPDEDEDLEAEDEAVPVASAPAPAPVRTPGRRRRGQWDPDAPPVVRAQAKYVRSSARKARLVCDHIRGKSVEDARAILALTPRAVAQDWSKLLESAVANAEHNHELVGEDLYVVAVHADEGPTIKRFQPRARGRATRIRKRTAHLTILLTPKE